MIRIIPVLLLAILLSSCGESEKKYQKKIDHLNAELTDAPLEQQSTLAKKLLDSYEYYIQTFPESGMNAEYLFRSAELEKGLGKPKESIQDLKSLVRKYPESEKAGTAMFLIAFTFHDELGQPDSAQKYFQQFLKEYPEHELKDDAEAYMNILTFSEEELLEFLKKDNDTIE